MGGGGWGGGGPSVRGREGQGGSGDCGVARLHSLHTGIRPRLNFGSV